MLVDLFSRPETASIFYTNDNKVLIDILVRQLSVREPPHDAPPQEEDEPVGPAEGAAGGGDGGGSVTAGGDDGTLASDTEREAGSGAECGESSVATGDEPAEPAEDLAKQPPARVEAAEVYQIVDAIRKATVGGRGSIYLHEFTVSCSSCWIGGLIICCSQRAAYSAPTHHLRGSSESSLTCDSVDFCFFFQCCFLHFYWHLEYCVVSPFGCTG